MAITSTPIMINADRSLVLVLGDYPIDKTLFTRRSLKFEQIQFEQLDDNSLTYNARGVLITHYPGKFNLVKRYFEERFSQACNWGLMTAVYSGSIAAEITTIRNAAYKQNKMFEDIEDEKAREHYYDSSPWVTLNKEDYEIAQIIAHYNPGPPVGNPRIIPVGETLIDSHTKLTLNRAFFDCERLSVKGLEGGKTAKATLQVSAIYRGLTYGPLPMPFFVKLGGIESIERETLAYIKQAEPFIPFHLRPSLNEERCVTTAEGSALVCNFVASAVTLRSALRTGQGDGAIFSLFEVTLSGLRSHSLMGPVTTGVIDRFLDPDSGRVRAHLIKKQHPDRIEKLSEYEVARYPEDVEKVLRECAAGIQTHEGPYHGDLHAGNIMVRNRDAIVIDFGSMEPSGPLSADPAILEVSLLFGSDEHDKLEHFEDWRNFINYIYKDPLSPPLPIGDYPHFIWLHKATRELRHVAICCGVGNPEALIILAGCLLRFGRLSRSDFKNDNLNILAEKRRVYALVMADRICTKLVEFLAKREQGHAAS
jgi:hypothetical protein